MCPLFQKAALGAGVKVWACVLLLAGFLSACGGGGAGGAAAGDPNVLPLAQGLRFTMDAVEGAPPQQIDLALAELQGTTYVDVQAGPGLRTDWRFSAAGVLLTVYPQYGSEAGLATQVNVRQCAQQACTQVLRSTVLPVTVVQGRGLSVAVAATQYLPAAVGKGMPSRSFALQLPSEPGGLTLRVTDGTGGPVNWMQATVEGLQLRLDYQGSEALPKGLHSALVTLQYERSNGKTAFSHKLGVNLMVDEPGCRPVGNAPSTPALITGHRSLETSLLVIYDNYHCYGVYRDQVNVRSERDGVLLHIEAHALDEVVTIKGELTLPWIAANLANRQTHDLAFVLSAPGLPDLRVLRQVVLAVPELTGITPRQIAPAQAQEILLQGYHLGAVLHDVQVSGLTGLTVRRGQCSASDPLDCELLLSLPALAPGRYLLSSPYAALLPPRAPIELLVGP